MKKVAILISLALSVALFSCNQLNNDNVDPEQIVSNFDKSVDMASDEAVSANISEEVSYEVDMYTNNQEKLDKRVKMFAGKGKFKMRNWLRYRNDQCPDVTIDSTNAGYPITITLNYGEGTEIKSGKILSGVIEIVISDSLFINGATRTVSYQDFVVDSVEIGGGYVSTFTGTSEIDRSWTSTSDVTFTYPDGLVLHRTSERAREWVSGLDTPEDTSDDELHKTGWVRVESSENVVYLKEITEPLVRLGDCKWLVSGEVTITENGVVIAVTNWGDGTCDSIITVTRDGETKEVDVEKRRKERNKENKNN